MIGYLVYSVKFNDLVMVGSINREYSTMHAVYGLWFTRTNFASQLGRFSHSYVHCEYTNIHSEAFEQQYSE